jgi:hypothetical protein
VQWFLDGPLPKLCPVILISNQDGHQAKNRWFSPGTPASSTTKTVHHDIAEILLKVALNTNNQIKSL